MNKATLVEYAEKQIALLGLADSATNCHGVVAQTDGEGVRLSDGIGLNVVCETIDEINSELEAMADWYAEQN